MGDEVLNQNEVLELLNAGSSVKILVTLDEAGLPHPAVKSSLRREGDDIVYTEFLESSRTNRYMIRSLWFNRSVSILILTPGGKSYKISALPVRAIVSGKIFQRYYEEVQKTYGDFDLASVWILKPREVFDQTLQKRIAEESRKRPYFIHLDRLAREAL
jgi:hypothetical protein